MSQINNISENRKAVAAEIAQSFYGINSNSIINIVKKFVRKAVREQDKPYCTSVTESFSAGADRYRIEIIGGYNMVIRGGAEKTDWCLADITIKRMGYNGRYEYFSGVIRMEEHGIAVATYAAHIIETIYVAYLEFAEDMRHYNKEYDNAIENALQTVMSDIVDNAQTEFDGYMLDLHMVAENYDEVEDRFTAMLASDIIGRMAKLGSDLLESLGDITGCNMVEGDGYWLDTEELEKWANYPVGLDMFYLSDIEDLVDTLVYMSTTDSGLPLGLEQESIDWIIMGEGNAYCGLQPLYTGETAYNFVMENV